MGPRFLALGLRQAVARRAPSFEGGLADEEAVGAEQLEAGLFTLQGVMPDG